MTAPAHVPVEVSHARGTREFEDVVDALRWVRTVAPDGAIRVVRSQDGALLAKR